MTVRVEWKRDRDLQVEDVASTHRERRILERSLREILEAVVVEHRRSGGYELRKARFFVEDKWLCRGHEEMGLIWSSE